MKYLFALFLLASSIFAQERNTSTYPYGGVPDSSRYSPFPKLLKIRVPLNFKKAQFGSVIFDSTASFYDVAFNSAADFRKATFKSTANFSYAIFNSTTDFSGATFDSTAYFYDVTFDSAADFRKATFKSTANFDAAWPSRTTFKSRAGFSYATFISTADFNNTTFDSAASFYQATFDSAAFSGATFKSHASFGHATFKSAADFTFATFDSKADFSRATFKSTAAFSRTTFKSTIHFTGANFVAGMAFRQAYFDTVDTIYLDEGFTYPDGKFLLYWDQLKAKDSLRIAIQFPPRDSTEHYRKIEITYHKLRDNFLSQRNNDSADDVMYELAWQRRAILKEWYWILFGWFFGWGYQPWRFLLFIVLPIILLFAVLWWKFYKLIVPIVDEKYSRKHQTANEHTLLLRLSRVLYFSASVLLSIRLKSTWLLTPEKKEDSTDKQNFVKWIWLQWALGILLLIAFAMLVKSSRFAIVKDLLGF